LSNPIPCLKTCTGRFVLLSLEGLQNIALIMYVPTVVWYPVRVRLVKFQPFCVIFKTKSVTSRLICGMSISKTACRAEMETGTVMFIHVLVLANLARKAKTAKGEECILEFLRAELYFCLHADKGEYVSYVPTTYTSS
jgi:hypothetical protein